MDWASLSRNNGKLSLKIYSMRHSRDSREDTHLYETRHLEESLRTAKVSPYQWPPPMPYYWLQFCGCIWLFIGVILDRIQRRSNGHILRQFSQESQPRPPNQNYSKHNMLIVLNSWTLKKKGLPTGEMSCICLYQHFTDDLPMFNIHAIRIKVIIGFSIT